jgi:hypothetical protein
VLCISKQAVNQQYKRQVLFDLRIAKLIVEAEDLKIDHPGCGVEKMYYTLKPTFIGRDKFIEIFMEIGFRVKRPNNKRRTTYAVFNKYPNLIKGLIVEAPSIVWQSDITYIEVNGIFYYAVFIIDVYTKKIVGYKLSKHMRATANMEALIMALETNIAPQIHHSDRGSQYIYIEYIKLLTDSECQISMALSAQDNAYAERINRTIKEEYLDHWSAKDFNQLKHQIDKAIHSYNFKRPHNHLNRMSPIEFEEKWKNKQLKVIPRITIFNNELV